jgi:hypothetical protein
VIAREDDVSATETDQRRDRSLVVALTLPSSDGTLPLLGSKSECATTEWSVSTHNYESRKPLFAAIEALRPGRTLIALMNFDRGCDHPIPLTSSNFDPEVKESLFRVLKDSRDGGATGIDLWLYTRGGDTNAVWPLVSLIREFDPDFEVLVPFRCHSAGTLVAIGAKRIVLGPLSELSPIDPSTGNQFNPTDPFMPPRRMPISVEDVKAYRGFIRSQIPKADRSASTSIVGQALDRLVSQVHPLALGNVHRVHKQIQKLARNLLLFHGDADSIPEAVRSLTTRFYSHIHMINRIEARAILGDRVEFASEELARALDVLLRSYEDHFDLRRPFLLNVFMQDEPRKDVRFIKGVVESRYASYLQSMSGVVTQHARIPPNVQVQIPPGQPMPLVPGLPRDYDFRVTADAWARNKDPQGFTK